jgi:hypothetical protein
MKATRKIEAAGNAARRLEEYDRLVRRLRNDPRLWDEDSRISPILSKALARRAKLRVNEEKAVGLYSGMTRAELRATRTCETDWY